jgi:2'-5' RNA ligase
VAISPGHTHIVKLRMDDTSQAFFERMRQVHFPPERNQIAAHLTLFHTLPNIDEVKDVLRRVAGQRAPFAMHVTGLRSLGRGVAYTLKSAELAAMHEELAEAFSDHLSAQDKQKFMPHVVVQNKAKPEKAKALLAELDRQFVGFEVGAVGLDLWHYLGGPWELAETFSFGY